MYTVPEKHAHICNYYTLPHFQTQTYEGAEGHQEGRLVNEYFLCTICKKNFYVKVLIPF